MPKEKHKLSDARSGTPPRVYRRDSLERQTGGRASVTTQTSFMFDPSPEPPKEATDLAFALLQDSMGRGMDYEEFTFEIDGGEHDGEEYKVVVMKI